MRGNKKRKEEAAYLIFAGPTMMRRRQQYGVGYSFLACLFLLRIRLHFGSAFNASSSRRKFVQSSLTIPALVSAPSPSAADDDTGKA